MEHKDTHEDEWKAEAPFLASLKRESAEEVPEGYFDNLSETVMAAIQAEEEAASLSEQEVQGPLGDHASAGPAGTADPKRLNRWTTWAVAASVALLAAVGIYFLNGDRPADQARSMATSGSTEDALKEVTTEDLLAYIDASDYSDADLLALADPDNIAGGDAFPEEEALIDYLESTGMEGIDLNDLELDASNIF